MDLLLGFVTLTIFVLMLTIGVNHTWEDLTALWHRPAELLRELLAVLVLVPAVALVLLTVFDLPLVVASGIALLAACPGAPLTTKRSQMTGAKLSEVASLQLVLALLAIVVTPLILDVFYAFTSLSIRRVSSLEIASQIARVTFLPVVIGLALRRFAPQLTDKIAGPLNKLANILFLLMVLALVGLIAAVPELREKLLLGWPAVIAILILALSAVSIGHLLGGPDPAQRAGLAIGCLARNIGLALFIAALAGSSEDIIPTLLGYMFLGTAVQVPYAIWIKRRTQPNSGSSGTG